MKIDYLHGEISCEVSDGVSVISGYVETYLEAEYRVHTLKKELRKLYVDWIKEGMPDEPKQRKYTCDIYGPVVDVEACILDETQAYAYVCVHSPIDTCAAGVCTREAFLFCMRHTTRIIRELSTTSTYT